MKKGLFVSLSLTVGALVGYGLAMLTKKFFQKDDTGKLERLTSYYDILDNWLIAKQKGISLTEYFNDYGYSTVAIYGMGELGNRLYSELKDTNIDVAYAIDKNASKTYSELNVINFEPGMKLENVDVMVVTPTFAYDEVREKIGEVTFPVVSLRDVIVAIQEKW